VIAVKVEAVMTKHVVSVRPETSLKDVAALLARRGISGVPVVDDGQRVLGVVSQTDILVKEGGRGIGAGGLGSAAEVERKLAARSAGEAMTQPAISVYAHAPVAQAARLLHEHGIDRLPVLDRRDRLAGIVTRADLVRAFARADGEIAHEIREEVLRRTFWIAPETIEVAVERGEVHLAGPVADSRTAELVAELVQRVPGVVAVRAELAPRGRPVGASR
jgi:CBS domain-containing protein